jgi:hypothetical protein
MALTEAPKTGAALVAAQENARRVRRAFMAAEKVVALAEAGPVLTAEQVPAMIAAGELDPESMPPEPGNLRRLRERLQQCREAMRLADAAEDHARRAAAEEIAETLRAGEWGRLQARVLEFEASTTEARRAMFEFLRGCDRNVQLALAGMVLE